MRSTVPERPRVDAVGFVVDALRTRPWARRVLSGISVGLLLLGLGLLAYPFATNIYQDRLQARLDRQLASPALEQAYRERRVGTGDSLTRIRIPALGVDVVVVEGTSASALRAGAGHYPETPLPCEQGNVAIAGGVALVVAVGLASPALADPVTGAVTSPGDDPSYASPLPTVPTITGSFDHGGPGIGTVSLSAARDNGIGASVTVDCAKPPSPSPVDCSELNHVTFSWTPDLSYNGRYVLTAYATGKTD